MDRLVEAVAVDQLVRDGRAAAAEALVGLLQRDDVGVDLLKHVEHSMRVAPAVEPDRLVHVVAARVMQAVVKAHFAKATDLVNFW